MSLPYCYRVEAAIDRLLAHKDTHYNDRPKLRQLKFVCEAQGFIRDNHVAWVGKLHGEIISEGEYRHLDWWIGYYDRPEEVAKVKAAEAEQDRLEKKLIAMMS